MVRSMFEKELDEEKELFSEVDVEKVLTMLRVQSINKLKELSERAGRRTISE